ncbi:hypothetical protein [Streptomyces sp. 8N706]|uniref:hypothetical protein n=1 Tax=Streptomyces sp. 8N706 TaxID=3457416 RepID=UPI003FD65821
MRTVRRTPATVLLLAAAVICPVSAVAIAVRDSGTSGTREQDRERPPYRAECRARVEGSRAIADCHNPYPESDLVRLHIECDRWWDLDVDTDPVEVGPARTVELSDRCWMGVREAWVTHTPGA